MSNFVTNLWDRLVKAIEGEATTVEATLTELEQKLLPGLAALCQKIATTVGPQGMEILEKGLETILPVISTGGNIGAIVGTLVSQATAEVSADLKQDANTAAHGALELLIAAASPAPAVETAGAGDAAGSVESGVAEDKAASETGAA